MNMDKILQLIVLLVALGNYSGALGSYFDCDPVNKGHYCLCAKGEPGIWDVQCPARILEIYPISLKITVTSLENEEANVRIVCDPSRDHFAWRLVQGVDFSNRNITFVVNSVDISYCPPIDTVDLQNFFYQMKLEADNIRSISYHSWSRNATSFGHDFLQLMPYLQRIDLRNNQIETLPSFQGLDYLSELNLRGNSISHISRDAFQYNPRLELIRLGGNKLSQLTYRIFPSSLRVLDLVDNHISTISNDSLSNLRKLEGLYLNNNPLERIHPDAFSKLKNLQELSVDHSKLFRLPKLQGLENLRNLSISYSLFSSTKFYPTLRISEGLSSESDSSASVSEEKDTTNFYLPSDGGTSLYGDGMEVVMTTGLGKMANAEHPLEIGDSTTELGDLHYDTLSLDLHHIKQNFNNEELIGDLFSLQKLILINDDLKTLEWLGYLPNLTDLVISKNDIGSIPTSFFKNIPSIVYADFSQNSILEIGEMEAPFLTFLDLSNNFVMSLEERNFIYLGRLKVLLMSTNKIEYIHPKAFEKLENLIILDLSNNRITLEDSVPRLSAAAIKYDIMTSTLVTNAQALPPTNENAVNGPPQKSPLKYCRRLEKINLRNNLIKKIFIDWTFELQNLVKLDLSYNKIDVIHPRDLHFGSREITLDLRYNKIAEIDMDFAEMLLDQVPNKYVIVLFDGNPIKCNCRAMAFKQFSVQSYNFQYSELTCDSPDNLKGRKFIDVLPSELRCLLTEACPKECLCWELPSENLIKMDCNQMTFSNFNGKSTLRNFTDNHEPAAVEINISGHRLKNVNKRFINDLTQQIRAVNLTRTGLMSLEFLEELPSNNNITKFALSQNPFVCDTCRFQELWWKHFRKVLDIRQVTCMFPHFQNKSTDVLTFNDLVKNKGCQKDTISDELKYVIVIFAIVVPVIIATIICISRLYSCNSSSKVRRSKSNANNAFAKKGTPSNYSTQSRCYSPTRSKVVDMDNSKF